MSENFDVNILKQPAATPNDGGANAGSSSQGANAAPAANVAAPAAASNEPPGSGTPPAPAEKSAEVLAAEKKIADDAAAAAAANPGATTKTQAEIDAEKVEADKAAAAGKVLTPEEIKKLAVAEMLKEAGVSTMEELKEKLKPKVAETDEEKAASEQRYQSNLDNFAVTNKLMSRDEIIELDTITKANANDIVFKEFSKDYLATKADATAVEIEQAFKLFYNIDSTDAPLKAIGEKLIQKKAEEVRSVLQNKRTLAKESFDDVVVKKSKVPAYQSVIKTAIKENVPESMELLSDGDNKVSFKLTPELNAEIEKFLVNNETFETFLKDGESPQLKATLKDKIEGYLFLKNREKIYSTIYEAGKAAGGKNGSTTGATASFQQAGANQAAVAVVGDEKELTEADRDKLRKVFGGDN